MALGLWCFLLTPQRWGAQVCFELLILQWVPCLRSLSLHLTERDRWRGKKREKKGQL